MILSRIEINNFKQFAGDHEIDVPSLATVGVIGANGVGKTTLFEAIEWCLYNQASVPARDLHPRGIGGLTSVTLTIEDDAAGTTFIVERELRKATANGTVRRVDADGEMEIVVQGTRQVTDYVASTLLGLDHKAFVATFFTRQKELGFFGDKPTERRREVGRLLGMETIRAAQQIIADDRRTAVSEARAYRSAYEGEANGRDFTAEIEEATVAITASTAKLDAARAEVVTAQDAMKAADVALEAVQKVKDADTALRQEITTLQGDRNAAAERLRSATDALAALTLRENERAEVEPVAAREPELRAEEQALEAVRVRAQRKASLEQTLTANVRRRDDTLASVAHTVKTLTPPAALADWTWDDADVSEPVIALERLSGALGGIDLAAASDREQAIRHALQARTALDESQKKLPSYERRLESLMREVRAFSADGDPAQRLGAIDQRRQELNASIAAANGDLRRHTHERDQTRGLLDRIRHQHVGETCPTCLRPFTADDNERMLTVFGNQLRTHEEAIASVQRHLAADRAALDAIDKEADTLRERVADLTKAQSSLHAGEELTRELRETIAAQESTLANALAALGTNEPPDQGALDRASADVQAWRRLVDQRDSLQRHGRTIATLATEREPLERELAELADVVYDDAAHRALTLRHQDALKAQTRLVEIDRDLDRRPQLEQSRDESSTRIADLDGQLEAKQAERTALGFDAAALEAARSTSVDARENERVTTELMHRHQALLKDAEHRRSTLENERKRIENLAKQAERREHDQADLDHMYREFTAFEQYAAEQYAPKLSEITSDLVAAVTDNKYTRVEFDKDFSIEIYDGEEEKFPWSTFSGGERDAIALCARIAMSRLIGGTGTQPPGFLVLDEVFGSLDLDRRQRLLEMLGTITQGGEHFRQVFIISHVDDVRTSPIFDELWQISENDAGTSELQALAHGTDIGEL